MKRLGLSLAIVLFFALAFTDILAQQAGSTPSQKRKPAAPEKTAQANIVYPTPLPVEKKKPGFFKRLFGKKEKLVPAPEGTSATTPTPKRKKRRVKPTEEKTQPVESGSADDPIQQSSPAVAAPALPDASKVGLSAAALGTTVPAMLPDSSSAPLPDSLPPLDESVVEEPAETVSSAPVQEIRPAAKPVSEKVKASPLNQPIGLVDGGISQEETVSSPGAAEAAVFDGDSVVDPSFDRARFQKIKARALEVASVRDLKAKADSAPSAEARYEALKVYYPALFAQMRQIDSGFSKGIARMEAAAKRRLERLAPVDVGNKIEKPESKSASAGGDNSDKKKSGG
ncbi:MAG TPA: hypothetical protein VIT91_13740 [Chthoniobacterales bacterium]